MFRRAPEVGEKNLYFSVAQGKGEILDYIRGLTEENILLDIICPNVYL